MNKGKMEGRDEQIRANVKCKLPESIRIKKAEKICKLYEERTDTIQSCCEAVGIKYETFKQWAQPNRTEYEIKSGKCRPGFIPAIHDLYKRARERNTVNYKALLKHTVRDSLLKRANGITVIETRTVFNYDLYGNQIGFTKVRLEKFLAPDVTLLIFMAKSLGVLIDPSQLKSAKSTFNNERKNLSYEELQERRLTLENELDVAY